MAKDVLITPADGDIQFKNASGIESGKIEQSGDDLVITNAVGDVLIGDGNSDIYVGNGVNNVDIIFEQNGSIRGETGAGVALTLGSSDTTLNVYNPQIGNGINVTSTMTIGTGGSIDFTPDTGAFLTFDGQTILERRSVNGAITFGHDDSIIIAGGDTSNVLNTNINAGNETVYIGAEGGLEILAFPNNDITWTNRERWIFHTDGKLLFGQDGDTNIYRDSANTLKTDDSFVIGSRLYINTRDINTTSTTALVMNGTEVEQRTLGLAAFSNTGDFAADVHTHAATDITSGLLNNARLNSDVFINDGGTYSSEYTGDMNSVTGFRVLRSISGQNRAFSAHHNVLNLPNTSATSYETQLAMETGGTGLAWRGSSNGTFTDWYTIWHSGNDGVGSGLNADLWDNEQFEDYLNQGVRTTDAVTFATVNTGQGNNELYAMNQNVRTSDSPQFINLYLQGTANPTLYFNGSSDVSIDMAIQATPEGLDFFEPEDGNKIHFRIYDDTGVDATFGYWVNGTQIITSERILQNVTNTQWDAAYTYSQVGHLPLSGGTITGDLQVNGHIRGGGQQLVLNAGESHSYATGQTAEYIYLNAEQGLEINSETGNWSGGWAARKTAYLRGDQLTLDGESLTKTDIQNFKTAYGWGNHANVGYITGYTDYYTTGATFNAGNGIITGTRNDGGTWTVDINNRFVPYSGGNMTGNLNWGTTGTGLTWTMNTDGAYIKFYNTGDGDTDSRLEYGTSDNGTEYHRWMVSSIEEMTLKNDGLRVTNDIYMAGNIVATQEWVQNQNYSNPTHPGDDFSVDTGVLTGYNVVSNIDINVTTDTLGHVTDANGVVSTRSLSNLRIPDTRAAEIVPNDYLDYALSLDFTDEFGSLGSWYSGITLKGWSDGYAAWQLIGGSDTSVNQNWYLRSGVGTSWSTMNRIWHSGDFTSTNISNWNTAYNYSQVGHLPLSGGTMNGQLTMSADIIPSADSTYDIGSNINKFAEGHFDHLYIGETVNNPRIDIYTEGGTTSIADTFTDTTTDKSYIYFHAGTSSNDPGYIMHETSNGISPDERNEGVLHLVPSDDNGIGDYVSIHGTNDPDCLKLHTSGLIETSSSYQLQIQSGNGSVRILDDLSVQNTIYTDSHGNSSQWNTAYSWGNHASVGYITGYTDYYTTGATFNSSNGVITFTRNDGGTYTVNITSNGTQDCDLCVNTLVTTSSSFIGDILSQDANPYGEGLINYGDRLKVDGTVGVKDSLTINYTDGTYPRVFPPAIPGEFFSTQPTGRVGVVNDISRGEWAFSAVSVANGANFTNRSGLLHSNTNAYRFILSNTTEENIRLNSEGNSFLKGRVAIGHDTPTEVLDVAGSVKVSDKVRTTEVSNLSSSSNLPLKINIARFFDNSNICNTEYTDIGATLHLRTNEPLANQSVIAITRGGQGTNYPSGITQDSNGNYTFLLRDGSNSARIRFSSIVTDTSIIDTTRVVLCGNSYNLDGGISVDGKKWSNGDSNAVMIFKKSGAQTDNALEFRVGSNLRGSISYSNTGTAYNVTSDYRLKENVVEITDGIERLKQLKPSRFNFISDADKVVDGFIAHEVQEVIPEAVTGDKDATEEYEVTPAEYDDYGNLVSEAVMGTRDAYQGIDQAKIVPLLTAALQEAVTKIESLEARIQALEGN